MDNRLGDTVDLQAVGMAQGAKQALYNVNCKPNRHSQSTFEHLRKHLAKVHSLNEFHGEIKAIFMLIEFENFNNIWMAQGNGNSRFTLKHLHKIRVVAKLSSDPLDANGPWGTGRARRIGFKPRRHTAASDKRLQPIFAPLSEQDASLQKRPKVTNL